MLENGKSVYLIVAEANKFHIKRIASLFFIFKVYLNSSQFKFFSAFYLIFLISFLVMKMKYDLLKSVGNYKIFFVLFLFPRKTLFNDWKYSLGILTKIPVIYNKINKKFVSSCRFNIW